MQRRSFLQLTAASIAAGQFVDDTHADPSKQVIVVGAGLAGLSATYMLERLGYKAVLLEASNRVGGRVRTLDTVLGRPEGGANVLGPNYGRALAYTKSLKINVLPAHRSNGAGILLGDTYIAASDWASSKLNRLPEPVKRWMPDQARSLLLPKELIGSTDWLAQHQQKWDYSALEFFQAQGISPEVIDWFARNNSYGNTLEQTSLLTLMRVAESIQTAIAMRQPTLTVEGGNSRLPEAIAAALKSTIHFESPVAECDQMGDEVKVATSDGTEYRGNAVLFAIPLTTLKHINFRPSLPDHVNGLIKRTPYHKVLQSHWTLKRNLTEPLPSLVWTNTALGRLFLSSVDASTVHINAWINGDDVSYWRVLTDQQRCKMLGNALAKIPNSQGDLSHDIDIDWEKEPYQQGVWASWLPGDIKHIHSLTKPQGRAFFAGEHTGASYSGMEGALESAERAVLQIDRRLS
jgi:monoamine oxidase